MIKGILFDKDGTLIEFYNTWMQAALWVVPRLLQKQELLCNKEAESAIQQDVLKTMGIIDGRLMPDGALSYKVYQEIAEDITHMLQKQDIYLSSQRLEADMTKLFHQCMAEQYVQVKPLGNLKQILTRLKDEGYAIGLATADTMKAAKECLLQLEIYHLFDYVGADEGTIHPKPHGDMFWKFQERGSLKAEEIAVVGDTYNDMIFAKQNRGVSIGVLSGACTQSDFKEMADYVLPSVSELEILLSQLKEQK